MSDDISELQRQVSELSRNTAGLPWRTGAGGADQTRPPQFAMITDVGVMGAGTSPHYSTTFDLSFSIPKDFAHGVFVQAVLLEIGNAFLTVYNPDGLPLGDLQFAAEDVRKEGLPKVGDVVRVWTSDGVPVEPGEETDVNTHSIWCDALNPTDYLRGLTTFDTATAQIPFHDAGDNEIVWTDASDFGSTYGGGGGGSFDPATNIAEGYAIDVAAAGTTATIHNDPTEWTGFASAFQFMTHTASENTARTDPRWRSVTGYDDTKTQLLGQILGTWHAKTIDEWLNLLTSYAAGSKQVIGHDAAGVTEWKTLASATINNPTSIELNLTTSILESKLNYTPTTILVWPAATTAAGANFSDNVSVTSC